MLSEDERERIESRLQEERDEAVEALRAFDRDRGQSLREETGELSVYRFHPADIGTEAMEREKQFLLGSSEGRRLVEVDDALRRLYAEPEEFGVCERCGRSIGMDRLEVVPAASLCAECKRRSEEAS